jgi:glycyl-tRNA synthetase
MDQSGVDNRVFRPYPRPVEVEEKRLVPDVDAIRKTFGDDFPKVMELVGTVDQGLLEDALTKKGSYEIDGFTITQNHVKAKTLKRKETGKRIVPHVVEPSFGADRLVYSAMEYAYSIKEDRVVLGLPKDIAPFQVVVLPLLKKSDLVEKANKIYRMLLEAKIDTYCDEVGSIGRRYARADEIGVPLAVTVDYETLTDGTLTVRHRDTWKQVRIGQTNLISHTRDFFDSK